MINYRKIRINEQNAPIIANLISGVFLRFNRNEGDDKSVSSYVSSFSPKHYTPSELKDKLNGSNINFGAFYKNRLVGILRGKNNRIISLFVEEKFHKLGIGKMLVRYFEKAIKNSGGGKIRVRASIYATPFYQKIGYKKTTGIRLFKGLRTQPMKKILK